MGFCRFSLFGIAHVAQLVERVLGKDEVISSILIMGSRAATIMEETTTPGERNG